MQPCPLCLSYSPDVDQNKAYSSVEHSFSPQNLSKSFAQLSLPAPLALEERQGGTSGAGLGEGSRTFTGTPLSVVARLPIKAYTQFGPLQGETILERDVPEDFDMKDLWQVGLKEHLIGLFFKARLAGNIFIGRQLNICLYLKSKSGYPTHSKLIPQGQ